MRKDLLEGLIIGGTIGLSVVAIRVLHVGEATLAQALVLAMAGVLLCGLQIALSRRRARFRRPTQPPPDAPQPELRRRQRRENPFAHETQNWTGLDDRLSQQSEQSANQDEQHPNA